jgi:hypothetical protein
MRWPWRRKSDAEEAKDAAQKRHRDAEDREAEVRRNVRAADETSRRATRYAREIQQSWQFKRGST